MQTPELAALLAAVQASVPALMRERKQWLLWRFEQYEGDKKPRKVPYYVSGRKRRGTQGSIDDREELATFDLALTHLKRGLHTGIGFAFLPGDGLVGIDIDGAIDADGVVSDRCQKIIEACASYTELSPSGKGVHIICSGQVKEGESKVFKDNSIGVEVYTERLYFTFTGRRWEGTPDTVNPLSDTVLARLRATVKRAKATAPRPATPERGTAGDLQARLESALQALGADLGHDDWVHVGMALKAGLGEGGFRLWDYWSSKGAKYPGSELLQRKWASFNGSGFTEATVFKMAMDAGWKPPRTSKPAGKPPGARAREGISTPSSGSASGGDGPPPNEPPPQDAAGAEPDDDDGHAWRDHLIRFNGAKKDCRENVYVCLVHHPALKGLVGYDEFSHRVMKQRRPPWQSDAGEWTTNDDYFLGLFLAKHERLLIKGEGTLVAGVAMAAYHNRYHPVLQYLKGLPAWDGVERLRHWLHECLGAEDSEYTRMVGCWFLMGMVKRVKDPGCQMDYMVVLEGLQGKRKSTALRTLVGHDDWFADTPMRLGDKDAMLSLAGKWLYEIGELDAFNKAEVTAVKQYVSSRNDRVREPFARRHVDRPRSGVFAGTTNQSEYFKDPTGARRFWPVACDGDIDLTKLGTWRDQLWAEALHRLNHADPEMRRCWPTREEEEEHLVPQQERREIQDPWFERLATWVDSKVNYGESGLEVCEVDHFTAHELLTRCLMVPMDRIDGGRSMATRVGIAMHKLGWEKHKDGGGARVHRYWRPGKHSASKANPQQQLQGPGGAVAAGGPAVEETVHEF